MRIAVIVQARLSSTRLPGKVMMPILERPMLEYQLERLRRVQLAETVVVATTPSIADAPIRDLSVRLGFPFFCGPERDVLSRFHGAARAHRAQVVVRVTADCPLIDPRVVDEVIRFYTRHPAEYDYVSNTLQRTYPRGMDCEVISFEALQEAFIEAASTPDREHVTPFIYRQPDRYRLANVSHTEDLSRHRWTVDTTEDFELIRRIIEALYPNTPRFTMQDCLELVALHPGWEQINAHIEQKVYGR